MLTLCMIFVKVGDLESSKSTGDNGSKTNCFSTAVRARSQIPVFGLTGRAHGIYQAKS